MPSILVTSSPPLRERYKNLLRSDWSLEFLDEIFSLLWDEIKDSPAPPQAAWWKYLAPNVVTADHVEADPAVVERLRLFATLIPDAVFPPIPIGFAKAGGGHLAAKAERAWTYLILQTLATIEGDAAFLLDTQSILFICSVDSLVPEVRGANLIPELACLLNALYLHTLIGWRDNPAHSCYLQSLLMDELKQPKRRLELLGRSFQLTPVEDHSYLTKAQALWSDLLDFGSYESAEKFLLDLYRYSPGPYLAELREMIHSMYMSVLVKR